MKSGVLCVWRGSKVFSFLVFACDCVHLRAFDGYSKIEGYFFHILSAEV